MKDPPNLSKSASCPTWKNGCLTVFCRHAACSTKYHVCIASRLCRSCSENISRKDWNRYLYIICRGDFLLIAYPTKLKNVMCTEGKIWGGGQVCDLLDTVCYRMTSRPKPRKTWSCTRLFCSTRFSSCRCFWVLQRDQDEASNISLSIVVGSPPPTPAPPCFCWQELIHVNPPKLEDYSSSEDSGSDDDDDARPLTREELKGRTLNKMQRKNAREGGGRGKGRGGARGK